MEYLEYDMDTGAVTLEVSSGNQDKGEMQELAGRDYNSNDSNITRLAEYRDIHQQDLRIQRCRPKGGPD